jgi:hypothetical protein
VTHQRRMGMPAIIWRQQEVTDGRGNKVKAPVRDPEPIKVWQMPERGARAEVPGQQEINVVRIGIPVTENVTLWSRVEVLGGIWDVASPPEYHHGTRHTRHQSLYIRRRPS